MTHARPMHVLYVAWGYPPCRSGGVYRALATANAFAAAGHEVTVLTANREDFFRYTGADESLEAQIDPRIEIERIRFEWPALETNIREWSRARVFSPELWGRHRRRQDVRDFPEAGYGPWKKPLEEAATRIHTRKPVDLVVATANPNVDFAAASHLHRTAGVPYVMDYRDAWMLDVFDGSLLHEEGSRVAQLERDLVKDAHEVWFVNEPIRTWHRERYPSAADKMHVVANGFDPEFAPSPALAPRDGHAPLTFGYIGTVSAKVPVAEFAAGWDQAVAAGGDLAGAQAQIWGYLGFYQTPNAALLRLINEHADEGISYAGPLPKRRVKEVYKGFDALLLILGTGKFVTSGKVYEYTASALPIVSVHDPDNAATTVLRGYPLWFPVTDLSPEAIASALTAAAHAARTADEQTRQKCQEFSVQYARDLQLLPRISELSQAVSAGEAS